MTGEEVGIVDGPAGGVFELGEFGVGSRLEAISDEGGVILVVRTAPVNVPSDTPPRG